MRSTTVANSLLRACLRSGQSLVAVLGWCVLLLACVAELSVAADPGENAPQIQRLANGAPGHVHPAICVAKSGAVLIAHFGEPDGKIFLLRSSDGGQTWTDLGIVKDIGGGQPYPGALTTLQDGRILLTWSFWVNPKDFKQGRRPYYALSADEGQTWSAPQKLPIDDHPDGYVRHSIWERSAGEWVFPLGTGLLAYQSAANQATPFGDPKLCHGPLVQTKSGTLLHATGQRSTDEGKTWSTVDPFPKVASYRCDMLALDNGWVVGAVAEDDKTFYLVVSYDDGQTWNLDRRWTIYDPGRYIGRACPQLAQLDKEHLGIVFWDAEKSQPGGIGVYFTRLRLDELQRRTSNP